MYSVLQNIHLNDHINISMQKRVSSNLIAGMISRKLRDLVRYIIASDKPFSFMNTIRGTPAG